MSDNGPGGGVDRYNAGLRGDKGNVYDGGLRVPFLIRWPGALEGGRKIDPPAAHIDVLPTLLDASGVDRPSSVDGKSLMSLLLGEKTGGPDRNLYFQWHRGLDPLK